MALGEDVLMMIDKVKLRKLLKQVMEIAEISGKKLLTFQKKIDRLSISHKKAQGVVSTADIAVEKFIVKKLQKIGLESAILAEEDSYTKVESSALSSSRMNEIEYTWAIDPLDGTSNFLNGLDYYCVSIALLHYGNPILGVIHRPVTGEYFYALKDQGAFKCKKGGRKKSLYCRENGKKLSDALLVTGFSLEKGDRFDKEFDIFKKMVAKGRGIRRMGSAALDISYVAEGLFDCFWERGLAPWDVAAAGLICLEAGAKVTDYKNKVFNPFHQSILACRSPLYQKIIKYID